MVCLSALLFLLAPSKGLAHFAGPLPQPLSSAYGQRRTTPCRFTVDQKSVAFGMQLSAFRQDWPELQSKTGRKINIAIDRSLAEEEYWLSLDKSANLRVGSKVAVAWALQTLAQVASSRIWQAEIDDRPDYGFRCVMIDVARRFHSLSTLRQIVRWCQAGKIRFIQLHLTDDQNWMLPTKVLPDVDRNNSSRHPAYTFEELHDLQAFATARGVSVIPELDIPGHSSLLIKLDPVAFSIEGSASGNCINFGSPRVLKTMRALIREIAKTFPESPYIHIGGDEAWYPDAEKDPYISEKMRSLGKNGTPQDVFVDFIAQMANEVIAEGKTPIVWEGFGPTAYAKSRIPQKTVVVAWEGAYYPAKDLVQDGFRVVNAGWDPCYVVNHYPYDAYTLVPLPTLYRFNPKTFGTVNWSPGTSGSVDLHPKGNLLGSMMCWWEGYEWNAQATLPIRILAMGSRLWNQSSERDYESFLLRSKSILQRIHAQTVPFRATVAGARPGNRMEFTDRSVVSAKSADPTLTIAMRSDGATPTPADAREKLDVAESSVVTIQAFRGSIPYGETEFLSLKKVSVADNLALGARAWGSTPEDPQFPASLVTDGVSDEVGSFWLGYPNPCSLTIDLGDQKQINRVDVVPFWAAHQPTQYEVDLSRDAKVWTKVVDASNQEEPPTKAGYVHRFPAQGARYIRVRITGSKQFPPSMARIHEVRAYLEH